MNDIIKQIQSILASVRTQYYVTVQYGYHTSILRPRNTQFYAPILRPQFYGPPEIRSHARSMNYPEMPCKWSIAGEYRGCSSL